MEIKVAVDNADRKIVCINSDDATIANLQAIFDTAPVWATPGNYVVRKTEGAIYDEQQIRVPLWQENLTAIIWERDPKPFSTIILDDDNDRKLVVMALEEYNTNARALDGLAPDWATPGNFKMKSFTEMPVNNLKVTVCLAGVNGIAFLWERNGRILKEGIKPVTNPTYITHR